MKEFIQRLFMDTPKFFRKLRNIGLSLSAIGTSLVMIPGVPSVIVTISGHLIWVGAVIATVSQAAVTNPDEIKK